MKICFLHRLNSFMAPSGLLQIAAIARELGHECFYLDMNDEKWKADMKVFDPHAVCCSLMSGEAKWYYGAASWIKANLPNAIMIAGGSHPTYFPGGMIKDSDFHVICRGEGETAFKVFLQHLANGAQMVDFKDIPNLVTKDSEDPMNIPMYALEHNLDLLPPPAWDLFYDSTHLGGNNLRSYIAGRSCPHRCGYCFNASFHKLYEGQRPRQLRKLSPEYIVSDLEHIRDTWGLKFLKLYDDVLVNSYDDWLHEFTALYRERLGIPFFCLMRADSLTEKIAKRLKWAGCQTISMSIEAKSETRAMVMDRHMDDQALIDAHAICRKLGISTFANVIVGLPDTHSDDDWEALELALRCGCTWIEYVQYTPYPETALGEMTFDSGYAKRGDLNVHTSYQNRSILTCFTSQEKDAQENFGTLGVVATLYPWFLPVARWLIPGKPRRIYLLLYYVVKMRIMQNKIYPSGNSRLQRWKIYWRSLKQEIWRRTDEEV